MGGGMCDGKTRNDQGDQEDIHRIDARQPSDDKSSDISEAEHSFP